jgi:hypothetical protein
MERERGEGTYRFDGLLPPRDPALGRVEDRHAEEALDELLEPHPKWTHKRRGG